MTTYAFKQLHTRPRWEVIKTGFTRRSQAEAYARVYISTYPRGEIVCLEHDDEHDAIDIMSQSHGMFYQFAIEPEKEA